MTDRVTLKILRGRAGKTQLQVGEESGIDRSRYNALERGRQPLTATYAARLAPVLGQDVWLLIAPPANGSPSPQDLLRALEARLAAVEEKAQMNLESLHAVTELLEDHRRQLKDLQERQTIVDSQHWRDSPASRRRTSRRGGSGRSGP